MRSAVLGAVVFAQSALLCLAGIATLWWSSELMRWLIWMLGEERALGSENVVRLEGGGTLLTNPGAMLVWTTPFWALGILQLAAAATLLCLWHARRRPDAAPT